MTAAAMTSRLRSLIDAGPVYIAGCFDALSARLAEDAGFRAAYISGFAVEATQLGSPDIGLITRTEMISHAARIAQAVKIPVLCDVDTGYGDVVNVARTVRECERAGLAGIQIEDQADPKKCPLLGAPEVLGLGAAVARVQAAAQARTDPDLVIIGRTDAYDQSFAEVVRRSNAYLASGADLAMSPLKAVDGTPLAALSPAEQLTWHKRYCGAVDGPLLGMHIPAGMTASDLFEAGYKVVILPTVSLRAAASAMHEAFRRSLAEGTAEGFFADHPGNPHVVGRGLLDLLGAREALAEQERYDAVTRETR